MKTGKTQRALYGILLFGLIAVKTSAQSSFIRTVNRTTPVDLGLQTAIKDNTGEIRWTPLQYVKVRRYELEKSSDGRNYDYVTSVVGNAIYYAENYMAVDRNPVDGISYYRLKIIDAEGGYSYSRTALLNGTSPQDAIKILPMQIDQKLFIWLPVNTSISDARITDTYGRNIQTPALIYNADNIAHADISRLPVGLYNISLLTDKGETVKLRFIKKKLA